MCIRDRHNAAHIAISVNDKKQMECLVCDGILVATPAGSSAYNLSAQGKAAIAIGVSAGYDQQGANAVKQGGQAMAKAAQDGAASVPPPAQKAPSQQPVAQAPNTGPGQQMGQPMDPAVQRKQLQPQRKQVQGQIKQTKTTLKQLQAQLAALR